MFAINLIYTWKITETLKTLSYFAPDMCVIVTDIYVYLFGMRRGNVIRRVHNHHGWMTQSCKCIVKKFGSVPVTPYSVLLLNPTPFCSAVNLGF